MTKDDSWEKLAPEAGGQVDVSGLRTWELFLTSLHGSGEI